MVRVRVAEVEDIRGLMDCQAQVLESLRGVLPTQFIEYQISWLRTSVGGDGPEKMIEGRNTIGLVAEEAGSIVGFAQGKVDGGGTSWLAYMGVIPAFRRRGVARALVERFLTESRTMGAQKVSLYTAPELGPAIKLYTGMGFNAESRTRHHRYGVDLILYSRSLD